MDSSWWTVILHVVLWTLLMGLVMGWVARSRNRTQPTTEADLLVHPKSTLIIGLVGFVFFLGIAVISNVYGNETSTVFTTAIFLSFALLSTLMIIEYAQVHHRVSEQGLNYGRLLRSRRHLYWSEVAKVRYAPTLKWFKIETKSGQVARISAMLVGLPRFAQTVLDHVSRHALDQETIDILQGISDGDLPPIWE